MKHLKMLGLLVMASASLMALASSASANPILTSPAGTDYTGTILASASTAGGTAESLTLKASVFTATCGEGTVHGTVTTNNTTHATGAIALTFGDCPEANVVVLAGGSLTIKDTGEVFAISNEVTVEKFGFSCIYGGSAGAGTKVGTLTGGTTASVAVSTKALERKAGSSPFCAEKAEWSGKYTITVPDTLLIT